MHIYRDEKFYDDLIPTKLGIAVAKSTHDMNIDLVIISHLTEENIVGKRRFCEKFFPKARHILVPHTVKKSSVINKEGLDYCTFIDDRAENIEDVVLNTQSFGKEFMLPKFGHNQEISRGALLNIHENSSKLTFYENVL